MSDLEKILQLVEKNDGYITTKEVVDNGLNKMALKRLCDADMLVRASTGYYSLPNIIDDYYKLISKSKNAVFSYATSLFLHELSDRTPLYFDITVPRGYGGSLQNIDTVALHYVDNSLLNLGMETIKSPFGMDIKCYDIERTICDIIKDRKHMDKEIYTKALKWYTERKDKDLLKLAKYSKKLNVEKEVTEIMQVIL
jgi:predicted transcriptional regulator of viral defense system